MIRAARLVLVLGLVACGGSDTPEIVKDWLLCDECTGGELDRLRSEGDRAVPLLMAALVAGPSPTQISNIEAQAASDFDAASRFRNRMSSAAPGAPAFTAGGVIAASVAGYDRGYRQRAIIGLDAIRTPRAIDSLRGAWTSDSLTPVLDRRVAQLLRAYAHGVSGISVAPMLPMPLGGVRQAEASIQSRPGVQFVVVWTTADPSRATVNATGLVTATGVGSTGLTVCVAGLPSICAVTSLRIQ
jgi:hypothetical protein